MSSLPLKISFDNGAIVKTVKFDNTTKVLEALRIIEDKVLDGVSGENYGLFLPSTEDQNSGIWLETDKTLEYYMLRDGDILHYLNKIRNLRVRLLDGTLKTLQVHESVPVSNLMLFICSKIGITNYDEYGLCREEKEEMEDLKPNTGTLTLKRKPQEKEKDKDAKMEHLRKKLKTDDDTQWLDSTKCLRELAVETGETVLLKRRLFYSDRNVDSRDPVQLNLLYVQARDAILVGKHPVTESMACEFAGIQCQIQFGDHDENKHTPDIIESKEFLPESYCKIRGIKRKILQNHMMYAGNSELAAKTLYVKTARSLPTYGVTFFLVKEKQKGKNRLVPRLLGIDAESIQRLDENTKETLVTWPLTHVQRWKANDTTFTLDFGEYSDRQYACQTTEARRIENVLKSYIDIILKKKKAKDHFGEKGPESEPMFIGNVGASRANIIQHTLANVKPVKEESYIGPSKIYCDIEGSQVVEGHQIVTVRQILATQQVGTKQPAAGKGILQATVDSDVLNELILRQRTLPKLLVGVTTRAISIVGLTTDTAGLDEGELRNKIKILNENLPDIEVGIMKACANDKITDQDKSNLLQQLEDLKRLIQSLNALSERNSHQNVQEIAEVSSKINEISTNLINAVDPAAKRRSKLLMSSRNSFLEEDLAESEREKRLLLLTLGKARENLNRLLSNLYDSSDIPIFFGQDLINAQRRLTKNLALINASTASLLATHADLKEIDYAGAKTAADTIMEIMPDIEKDAKIITNSDDDLETARVKEDIRKYLDSIRNLFENVGSQDSEKLNDAAITTCDTSTRFNQLCYSYFDMDKKNEILKLTRVVEDETSDLLLKTNELAITSEHGISSDIDSAAGRCVDATRRLVTCAHLAAPFIHEPRCQSAMLSSTSAVASSVEDLARSWKPLASNSTKEQIDDLVLASMEVANSLDALRDACKDISVEDFEEYENVTETVDIRSHNGKQHKVDVDLITIEIPTHNGERQMLLEAIDIAQSNAKKAIADLNKPYEEKINKEDFHEIQKGVIEKLGQVNAAVGSLLALHIDTKNVNISSKEEKVRVIGEMLPEIVTDVKIISYDCDPEECDRRLNYTRQFCETGLKLCDYVKKDDVQKMNESAKSFGENTVKVLQAITPVDADSQETKEAKVAAHVNNKLEALLRSLHVLIENTPDESAAKYIITTMKSECADAVKSFNSYSMMSHAPHAHDSMLNATHELEHIIERLEAHSTILCNDSANASRTQQMRDIVKALRDLFDQLRETTAAFRTPLAGPAATTAAAVRAAKENLERGPAPAPLGAFAQRSLQTGATENLARAGAAAAMLLAAHSDPKRLDASSAKEALQLLAESIPSVVYEIKCSSANYAPDEQKRRLQLVGVLCDATDSLCQTAGNSDSMELKTSFLAFGGASFDVLRSFNHDTIAETENRIIYASKCLADDTLDLLFCTRIMRMTTADSDVDINDANSHCADAAELLYAYAKLSVPYIHEKTCRDVMISSIEALEKSLTVLHENIKAIETNKEDGEKAIYLLDEVKNLKEDSVRLAENLEALANEKKTTKQLSEELEDIVQHVENARRRLEDTQDKPIDRNILNKAIKSLQIKCNPINNAKKITKQFQDYLNSMISNSDAITTAVKDISSICEAQLNKKLEENSRVMSSSLSSLFDLVPGLSENTLQPEKFDQIEKTIKIYENQIGNIVEILSNQITEPSELKSRLKRTSRNLAENCRQLRNSVNTIKSNKNVANLEEVSGALTDMELDLDQMFVAQERLSLKYKPSHQNLYDAESELMFKLATIVNNKTCYPNDVVPVLRGYIYELIAFSNFKDVPFTKRVIVHLRKIIYTILLFIWYRMRHEILNGPFEEDRVYSLIMSTFKDIEDATYSATKIPLGSNNAFRKAYVAMIFPSKNVAGFNGTRSELIDRIARDANRLAMSVPLAAITANEDVKNKEAASLAAAKFAILCAQSSSENKLVFERELNEAMEDVKYAVFKLLQTGEYVAYNPEASNSKRILLDACHILNSCVDKMVRLGNPKEELLQQSDGIARALQIHNLLVTNPMQPVSSYSRTECLKIIRGQRVTIDEVMSQRATMKRKQFTQSLLHVNDSLCKTTELAAHAAYLLSITAKYEMIAQNGLPDPVQLEKLIQQGKKKLLQSEKTEKVDLLTEQIIELTTAIGASIEEFCTKIHDVTLRSQFEELSRKINSEQSSLIKLYTNLSVLSILIKDPNLTPVMEHVTPQVEEKQATLVKAIKDMNSKFLALLLKEIKAPKTSKMDTLQWHHYKSYKKDLLESTDTIIKIIGSSVTRNSVADTEAEDSDEEISCKNYLQKQINLATKWLEAPCCNVETKNKGIVSVRNVIDQANKISECLRNGEKEELQQLSSETGALFEICIKKYDNDKSRQLIDKLHELKKTIEKTVINRVVEDFINDEEIMTELSTLVEYASADDKAYKYKLEKSIASLLEHLGRITTTARIVAIGGNRDKNITQKLVNETAQAELLAPKLVQAAKMSIETSENKIGTEEFIKNSVEYSETLNRIRDLCDHSVDPLDFVRTAGEVMQKMCEETSQQDPLKATIITRLANRVIQVGASESAKTENEELADALNKAKSRLRAVLTTPDTRKSQIPDWRTTTVEIMRSANEVESALNGETIFKKEIDPDQPIFMAAHGLHAAVREWSARDNELVAIAKRMAVQMARLSECMKKDQKQTLIQTAKSIVELSAEATRLARKLAMECTDFSLRKNLLQVCEKIPTIGGQLKMLSTVKATRFGSQGTDEDQEAMTMLVGNAQNLMQTIEDAVKAAAGASVKIRSDRGAGKLRWVRKPTYFN